MLPRTATATLALLMIAAGASHAAGASQAAGASPAAGAPSAAGELIAARITADNFATHHVGGPDADAGIGDWFLSNGTLCAALSDIEHESALTPYGGVLIDLGHCGRDDDQWAVLQPMLNLSQSHVIPVESIEAGQEPGRAWLRTRAVWNGVEMIATYSVDATRPEVLGVSTRARRIDEGDRFFSIGQILLHPSNQTPIFSLLRSDLDRSVGFVYPEVDRRSITSLLSALIAADLHVLVGGDAMPPISYGMERVGSRIQTGEEIEALSSFSVTGKHFSFVNAMTSPLWFGEDDTPPGLLQFAQIPFMDLEGETRLESDYRIHIGARADVASITDALWPNAPLVTGSIDDPSARIHFDRASGAPFTELRPNPDGSFALRLPLGVYRARALAPAGRETAIEFEISELPTSHSLPAIALGAPAEVSLPRSFVGRLTFLALDGSGPARFGSNLLGQRIGAQEIRGDLEAPFVNLAGSPADPERIALAPGRYRVVVVRGPEYEARTQEIEVQAGQTVPLEIEPLERIAPTPGFLAADFHVHSGQSFDSSLPQTRQIAAFVASGAELLVATEHDRVVDPRPAIEAARLGGQLASMTGVEVTSSYEGADSPYATGHLNAFPMIPIEAAYRRGAPTLEGRRLRDALADIARLEPAPFVQMNHPRAGEAHGEGDLFFSHLGIVGEPFEPTRPLTVLPNVVLTDASPAHGGRDLDYHGVELMNAGSLLRYRRTRADWFSLMLQGKRLVGTANSDSHSLGSIVGLPRTYVRVADDRLEAYDEAELMRSLRAGAAWGTTGPLLRVQLDETGLGGLHRGTTGRLQLSVDAAPWVPISEWRAYVNGELVHRAPIGAGQSATLPLAFAADAFVTVEIEGPAEGLYREALPGFVPFAFTNPIFVDADGNGSFDAPGLPADLPQTLTDPDRRD